MKPESADFVDTIVRLIRLTHQGKLVWEKEISLSTDKLAPTYTAEIDRLKFILEDVLRHPEYGDIDDLNDSGMEHFGGNYDLVIFGGDRTSRPTYRLIIKDYMDEVISISPAMFAADDLAAIIKGYDPSALSEVNRLLDAALERANP